jgi:RNA polymerase sigma-70 factor (ECF subfamily)
MDRAGAAAEFGEHFDAILTAAQAGGEWAWRRLYEANAPGLLRYLRARGEPDAEDIVGETFVRIVWHLDRFVGDEAAFRTWLFTIARNIVVDGSRKRARRPAEPVPHERLHAVGLTADVEDEAMQELSDDHVREVLDELSPDQRDVLLLRILGGFTIVEISQVLSRREGAIKMLQARGLASIRRKISLGAVTL